MRTIKLSTNSITASLEEAQEDMQKKPLHIAQTATENDAQLKQPGKPEARVNKYIYPEFEGHQGEKYLIALAAKFAPSALARTWFAMTFFYQAPGNTCYVGIGRLTDQEKGSVGVRERKIYKDIEDLIYRGWLRLERVFKPFEQEDGSTVYHPATEKDFSGFYDTAHDYHLWLQDKTHYYIAPEWENVPLIRQMIKADEALGKRLLNFENYRRLLVNDKPGRKPKERPSFQDSQLEKLTQKMRTLDPKLNLYSNAPTNSDTKEDAAYVLESTSESRTGLEGNTQVDTSSILSTPEREDVARATIGKIETESASELATDVKRHIEHVSTSKPNTPPTNESRAAAAKESIEALGYTEEELKRDSKKRGAAAAGISAEQYRKLNGGCDRQEEQAAQPPQACTEREFPPKLASVITDYAGYYDDPGLLQSDITRFKKIYSTAEQALSDFKDTLFWGNFSHAQEAAGRHARKKHNSQGRVNRVPYMFTCLENAFKFSLEELVFLRTEDPLCTDYTLADVIDYLREQHQQQHYDRETRLDYRSWLQDLLDRLEEVKEPKQRGNVTQREY